MSQVRERKRSGSNGRLSNLSYESALYYEIEIKQQSVDHDEALESAGLRFDDVGDNIGQRGDRG